MTRIRDEDSIQQERRKIRHRNFNTRVAVPLAVFSAVVIAPKSWGVPVSHRLYASYQVSEGLNVQRLVDEARVKGFRVNKVMYSTIAGIYGAIRVHDFQNGFLFRTSVTWFADDGEWSRIKRKIVSKRDVENMAWVMPSMPALVGHGIDFAGMNTKCDAFVAIGTYGTTRIPYGRIFRKLRDPEYHLYGGSEFKWIDGGEL